MNSLRSKNPKKKRRIDEDPEPLPGPSSASLPLVAPRLFPKTSKGPNRGMHPHAKRKVTRVNAASSLDFASWLAANSRQELKAVISAGSSSDEDEPPSEQVISHTNNPSTSNSTGSRKQLLNNFATNGKRKVNIPIKVTRFFKSVDSFESASHRTDPVANKVINSRTMVTLKEHRTVEAFRRKNWDIKDKELLDSIRDNESFFKVKYCYCPVDKNSVPEEVSEHPVSEDYFKCLPTHVIETILCQIPMIDLMSCRSVCSRWLDIIDNAKFMEWKKLYYRYKKESSLPGLTYQLQIQKLVDQLGHKTVEDCISTIIKFMGKHFNRIPSPEMYSLLIQNSHGELADCILSERFPEWNAKESRVWCQLAIAIIICETVWDILDVYKSLFTSKSGCVRPDVNDAMYSIATFLLHFRLVAKINCGLHYRLYYTLYLIENNIPFCQREKMRIFPSPIHQSLQNDSKDDSSCLTFEQIRVLKHRFGMNQKIKILALAGTGKTMTLIHLAKLYPEVKFLNLVYNETVNEDAKKKFPPNVTCKTAHALAFSTVGKVFRHKLTLNLRAHELTGHLSHNEDHIPLYTYAKLVLRTIDNFTKSNCFTMSVIHVPLVDFAHKKLSHANKDRILLDAYKIWQKMIDKNSSFKLTCDAYLKLYHLQRPKLNKFQCIMVDEAQDCHPVILDLVLSQSMPVIFVGDPQQQIRGAEFRGAYNSLEGIKATHTYHLTKSFRFGPQISYIASCILEILLHVKTTTLVGNASDSNLCGDTSEKYAIIARTNVVLFNEALRMIVFKRLKPYEPTFIQATFAGGIDTYGFDEILDIYKLKFALKTNRQLQNKFIRRFRTYSELIDYAKRSDDGELLSKIELVNQHGHDISKFIAILTDKCSSSMEVANVVFSTTHKSKGLEFETVSLADDYPISTVPGFVDFGHTQDEVIMLYIALTRAKKCLLLPEKITKVLHLAHEKFEYPVSSKALLKSSPQPKCVICNDYFVPHTVLVILRRKSVMSSGREIPEGPMCMKCSSDPYMRPDVHMNNLVMYLDPTRDNYHRFMSSIAGPLPQDPPIVHDRFSELENGDRVFVINLNIH